MKRLQQMKELEGGVDHWNALRKQYPYLQIDFSRIDFSGVDLSGVDFSGANLRDSNFTNADLSFANLKGADFGGAIMTGAKLFGSQMEGAIFEFVPDEDNCENVAREPFAVYHSKYLAEEDHSPVGPSAAPETGEGGRSELRLLFDSEEVPEEDIAGAIAFLNDMYVSIGGDQLVINGFEAYPISA